MHKIKHQNKIPKSFFVAIGVALFFWLLTKLSKEYQTVITLPVVYVNLPQDKLIQSEPLKKIDIQVKATGFRLLGISIVKKTIKLDASKLQRKSNLGFFFLIEHQKIDIQNQVSNNFMIGQIVQDTMYLDLGQLATKKVPVKGDFDFNYQLGFHLTKPIKITPDSVLVSGPQKQLDTLSHLQLQKLAINDISKSIKQTLTINEVSETIKFQVKNVEIFGEVDRFTEGSFETTFEIINMPDSIRVNTFPKTIKIVYQVGLTNFNKVTSTSFKVVCDFRVSQLNNLNYLIPKVITKPGFVTSVKLMPAKIEYLIQK